MKQLFYVFLIAILFVSCSSEQDQVPSVGKIESELRDIWVLQEMQGFVVDTTTFPIEIARLEVNPIDSTLMGTTGCNNINGLMIAKEDRSLQFGPIASTKKYCIEVPEAQFLSVPDPLAL